MNDFALQKKIKTATVLVFTMMALFLSTESFSQDFKLLKAKSSDSEKSTANASDLKNLKALISQLQPTLYFFNGKISTYGETSPVRFETDIQGAKNSSEVSSKLKNVKIAKIILANQSDLNSKIDMDVFESFSSLKYIYIVSNFEVNETQISNMILNANPDILVLFSTSGK